MTCNVPFDCEKCQKRSNCVKLKAWFKEIGEKPKKTKPLEYNKEPFALLENDSIQCLYFGDGRGGIDYNEPRNFYREGKNWYLDYDDFLTGAIVLFHHKIVKFLSWEEAKDEIARRDKED